MMPYNQRDLLLVPIPFSDLTSHKIRPVVMLSKERYNRDGYRCVRFLVLITTMQ